MPVIVFEGGKMDQGKKKELEKIGLDLALLDRMSLEDLEKTSGAELYRRLGNAMVMEPAIAAIMVTGEMRLLGLHEEDGESAIAAVEIRYPLRGKAVTQTRTIRIRKRRDGAWAVGANESVRNAVFRELGVELE